MTRHSLDGVNAVPRFLFRPVTTLRSCRFRQFWLPPRHARPQGERNLDCFDAAAVKMHANYRKGQSIRWPETREAMTQTVFAYTGEPRFLSETVPDALRAAAWASAAFVGERSLGGDGSAPSAASRLLNARRHSPYGIHTFFTCVALRKNSRPSPSFSSIQSRNSRSAQTGFRLPADADSNSRIRSASPKYQIPSTS